MIQRISHDSKSYHTVACQGFFCRVPQTLLLLVATREVLPDQIWVIVSSERDGGSHGFRVSHLWNSLWIRSGVLIRTVDEHTPPRKSPASISKHIFGNGPTRFNNDNDALRGSINSTWSLPRWNLLVLLLEAGRISSGPGYSVGVGPRNQDCSGSCNPRSDPENCIEITSFWRNAGVYFATHGRVDLLVGGRLLIYSNLIFNSKRIDKSWIL